MNRLAGVFAVLALALSACAGEAAASTPPPQPAVATPPAAPEATAQITDALESGPVDIPGAEGLTLRGTWTAPTRAPAPAVLLLHMYGRSRSDWQALTTRLQSAGLAVLAIDLRGHGETGGTEDWDLAREDVRCAYQWLDARPEVDPNRVATLGASLGANLSLWLGAQESGLAAILLLSPGFEYFRVRIEGLVEAYGVRPIFLAAAEDDPYSAETVRDLAAAAAGTADLIVYPEGGHGTDMLFTAPDLADRILAFLNVYLAPQL